MNQSILIGRLKNKFKLCTNNVDLELVCISHGSDLLTWLCHCLSSMPKCLMALTRVFYLRMRWIKCCKFSMIKINFQCRQWNITKSRNTRCHHTMFVVVVSCSGHWYKNRISNNINTSPYASYTFRMQKKTLLVGTNPSKLMCIHLVMSHSRHTLMSKLIKKRN